MILEEVILRYVILRYVIIWQVITWYSIPEEAILEEVIAIEVMLHWAMSKRLLQGTPFHWKSSSGQIMHKRWASGCRWLETVHCSPCIGYSAHLPRHLRRNRLLMV